MLLFGKQGKKLHKFLNITYIIILPPTGVKSLFRWNKARLALFIQRLEAFKKDYAWSPLVRLMAFSLRHASPTSTTRNRKVHRKHTIISAFDAEQSQVSQHNWGALRRTPGVRFSSDQLSLPVHGQILVGASYQSKILSIRVGRIRRYADGAKNRSLGSCIEES